MRLISPSADYLVGELLTCLYVGICRCNRGEKLSAWRFNQGYCLDRFLELAEFWDKTDQAVSFTGPYNRDCRFKAGYPGAAQELPDLLRAYDQVPESCMAFLLWLEARSPVNVALARGIRKLCTR